MLVISMTAAAQDAPPDMPESGASGPKNRFLESNKGSHEMNMSTQYQREFYPELKSRPMTAMVYDDYGPPDMLHQASLAIPERLPGELLIQVAERGSDAS